MRKLTTAVAIIAFALMCGCKSVEQNCSDGPVAPDRQSYEKSDSGDPQLPSPNVWWR